MAFFRVRQGVIVYVEKELYMYFFPQFLLINFLAGHYLLLPEIANIHFQQLHLGQRNKYGMHICNWFMA